MRLYPPVVLIIREALEDDEMCGVPVKKGEIIMIYPWIVHRHRKLWDQPDQFDISRFSPLRKAEQHRFQYLPFGAGPRICVGQRFATVEALTILAHWLTSRRFALPADALWHDQYAAKAGHAAVDGAGLTSPERGGLGQRRNQSDRIMIQHRR